jgi:hypothetical protein
MGRRAINNEVKKNGKSRDVQGNLRELWQGM